MKKWMIRSKFNKAKASPDFISFFPDYEDGQYFYVSRMSEFDEKESAILYKTLIAAKKRLQRLQEEKERGAWDHMEDFEMEEVEVIIPND